MPNRADYIAAAREWIDTPWRHQGRNEHGIDCAGLIEVSAWSIGISDVHTKGYTKRPKGPTEFLRHFLAAGCNLKPHTNLRPADLLIMKLERYPFHCGIYTGGTGDGKLIHAYARDPWRCVVEMPFSGELRAGWTYCLEVPGLSD